MNSNVSLTFPEDRNSHIVGSTGRSEYGDVDFLTEIRRRVCSWNADAALVRSRVEKSDVVNNEISLLGHLKSILVLKVNFSMIFTPRHQMRFVTCAVDALENPASAVIQRLGSQNPNFF